MTTPTFASRRRQNAALTIIALLFGLVPVLPSFVPTVHAAGIQWDGSESSDWNDTGNWVGDVVPEPGDDVTIAMAPNYPTLTGDVTVTSLIIESSTSMTTDGYDLTVTGSFDNQGSLFFDEVTAFPADTDSGTCVLSAMDLNNFASSCFDIDATNASMTNTLTINGSLTMRSGVLQPLVVSNTVLNVTEDFYVYDGLVEIDKDNMSSYLVAVNVGGDMDFTSGAGTGVMDFNGNEGDLAVGGDLLLTSDGFFQSEDANISIGGDALESGATVKSLTLTGCDQTIEEDWTVVDFTKTTTDACTLTLGSDKTFAVSGVLTLEGDADSQLSIVSTVSVEPSRFDLIGAATVAADYLTIEDNFITRDGGSIGAEINPPHSTDGGNTYGWFDSDVAWDGSASTDWDTAANWTPAIVPETTDDVTIVNVANDPLLATNVTVHDLTIEEDAILNQNGYNLIVDGTFENDDGELVLSAAVTTFPSDIDSGTCTLTGVAGGDIARDAIDDCFNMELDASSQTWGLSTTIDVKGDFTIVAGTWLFQNGPNILGNLIMEGGAVDMFNRDITIGGDLILNGGVVEGSAPYGPTIEGDVVINDGELDSTLFTLHIGGDFTMTGGNFTAPAADFDLIGCDQTIWSEMTFGDLTKHLEDGDGHCTLTLIAGHVHDVAGTLSLKGFDGDDFLSVESSVDGTSVTFDLQGSATAAGDYMTIKDNTLLTNGGSTSLIVAPAHSTDGGNTYGWFDSDVAWDGSASTDWDTAANWTPAIVPGTTDDVTIVNVANDPLLATNVTVHDLMIEEDAILNQNGHELIVDGTFENDDGELVFSAAVTTFPSDIDSGTCTLTGVAGGNIAQDAIDDCFNIRINALGAMWQISNNSNVRGNFTLSAGTWAFQNGPNVIAGDLVLDGGAVDLFGGTPTVQGDLLMSGGLIAGISATGMSVLGDVEVSGGTLNATQMTLLFAGDFTMTAGTFTPGGSAELTGCDQTIDVSLLGGGEITFGDLTMEDEVDDGAQCELTIVEGTTLNVLGALTLNGFDDGEDMDDLLVVQSDDPGSEAMIHFENGGTFDGSHLYVVDNTLTDSNGLTILPLNPEHSENGGNSLGWFPPPDPPTDAPDLQVASDSGTSNSDDITNDATPTVTVNCLNGATVTLYSDLDGEVASALCANDANSSLTASSLSDGTHAITATFTSDTGESDDSPTLTLVIDTAAPSTPGTPNLDAASDTGTSNTDNVTSDTTPTFTVGSCEDGVTVTLSGATVAASTSCDGGGSVSITLGSIPGNGVHDFNARQVDAAGNASAWSTALSVTIDSVAPGAPVITAPVDSEIVNTPTTVQGTCVAGSVIHVANALLSSNPTNGSCGGGNTFSFAIDWEAGADGTSQTLTVTQEDTAGNVSASDTVAVNVSFDSPPDAPSSPPNLTAGSDTGASNTDDITNDPTPTFTGSCTNGHTVTLYIDGTDDDTDTCSGGAYSLTASAIAVDGSYDVTVTFTNGYGEGDPSDPLVVTLDTTAPGKPADTDLEPGSDTGVSSTDDLTNDTTPTFGGTCTNGQVVTLFVDGVADDDMVCSGSVYSLTSSVLIDGNYDVTITVTDTAGNESAASDALTITIDTTGPLTVPAIVSPTAGSQHEAIVTVSGTCTIGVPVIVSNALLVSNPVEITCGGDGNFSVDVTFTSGAAGTVQTLSVTEQDDAGNDSSAATVLITIRGNATFESLSTDSDAANAGGRRGNRTAPLIDITRRRVDSSSSPHGAAESQSDGIDMSERRTLLASDLALVRMTLRGHGACMSNDTFVLNAARNRRIDDRVAAAALDLPITRGAMFDAIAEALCLTAQPGDTTVFTDLAPGSSISLGIIGLERRSIVQGFRTPQGELTHTVGPFMPISMAELRTIFTRLRRMGLID